MYIEDLNNKIQTTKLEAQKKYPRLGKKEEKLFSDISYLIKQRRNSTQISNKWNQ